MPKILKQEETDEDEFVDDDTDLEEEEELVRKPIRPLMKVKPKAEPKRRFGIVAPQTIKIVDTETNEVIGDGDFAVVQALTDILERLERIETQIGAVLSG